MEQQRRVQLRLIQDRTSRLARFSKRRAGLLKKARELSVLCDAEVGLVIFSPLGKHTHFSSRGSMEKTILRYQNFVAAETSSKKQRRRHKCQSRGLVSQKMSSELLDVARRLSEGWSTKNLNANDLERLQQLLDGGLRRVRDRMMELMMTPIRMLKEKEKTLLHERNELRLALGMDGGEGDGEHTESRENSKDNRGKSSKEDVAEQCIGAKGMEKVDTALRMWSSPFPLVLG